MTDIYTETYSPKNVYIMPKMKLMAQIIDKAML